MYTVFADDICIYNPAVPSDSLKLIDPKLTFEDSAAGSFEFTMPPENAGYLAVTRLATKITVREDDNLIWEGRCISDEVDFWNNRKIFAEGALAYLNDTIQPLAEYENTTPEEFLYTLLGYHNAYAPDKYFWVGEVTVTDPMYFYTNYESTIACINDKLISALGGHLRVRYDENGNRYIDYLADYPRISSQTIEFGENLIDFTRSWDATDYATVILPFGAALDTSPVDGVTAYLTVESVNDGSPYIVNEDAVSAYGWVAKTIQFDDISDPNDLMTLGQMFLENQQFDAMTLEMTAADLHSLDVNTESFKLLDLVQCVSIPHGMNRYFPIKRMDIALDYPESTTFSLGTTTAMSLTASSSKATSKIIEKLGEAPPVDQAILGQAEATARRLVNDATSVIGGWQTANDCLFVNVDIHGTLYRFKLQPPVATENTWMICCERFNTQTEEFEALWGVRADGTAFFPAFDGPLTVYGSLMAGSTFESIGTATFDTGAKVRGPITIAPNGSGGFNAQVYSTSDHDLYFLAGTSTNNALKLGREGSSWGLYPSMDAGLNLGMSGKRWANIYATNGTIQTSDRNSKYDIREIGRRAEQLIMGLKPVSFKMTDGTSGRDHLGFVAQDVETTLKDMGLTTKEFGGIVKAEKEDGTVEYGLRYDEFIAPLVEVVQHLRAEVDYILGRWKG